VTSAMNSTIPAPWGGDSRIQEISLLFSNKAVGTTYSSIYSKQKI